MGAQRQEAPELPRTIRVGPNEGENNVASVSMREFILCMIKVSILRMVEINIRGSTPYGRDKHLHHKHLYPRMVEAVYLVYDPGVYLA